MATELVAGMDAAEVKEESLARWRESTLVDAAEWSSKVSSMNMHWV